MKSKKYLLGALSTGSVQRSKLPKWECPPTYNAVKKQLAYAKMAGESKTVDKTPIFRQNQ